MSFNIQKDVINFSNPKGKLNSLININSNSYKFIFNSKKILEKEKLPIQTQSGNRNSRNIKIEYNIEKNVTERNIKNINLFSRISRLLSDFQIEKNKKNRLYKSNKKTKKIGKENKSQKGKKMSSSLIPQKKVYYITPKVKNQMQLNHYLINDFKETDSEQAYITRSLKYQKMNEELDELVFMNQIKEAEKLGVSENIMNEYEKKNNNEFFENGPNFFSEQNDLNENNQNILNKEKKKLNLFKNKKRSSVFNKNNYDLRIRRLYNNNLDQAHKTQILNKDNNIKEKGKNNLNEDIIYPNIISKTIKSDKENSISEINDKNKIKNNSENELIIDKNNQNNLKTINITHINDNNIISKKKNNSGQKKNKKKKTKKENLTIDKYAFSNKIYLTQKIEYNKYLKSKYIMRGRNFSNQMSLLHKEKEKFGIDENESPPGRFPKLNHTKLLYQIQLKDTFTNSFKSMRLFNEGDQDLDLDNLNKIKHNIKDYEIEMTRIMRNAENLNNIKKRFNKSTVGKYHSSRGIYM